MQAEVTGDRSVMWSERAGPVGWQGSAACAHAGPANPAEALVVDNSQTRKAEPSTDEVPDRLHFQRYHDACPFRPIAVVACPLVLR